MIKKIVALTGAGISKPSGIPTFEDLGIEFRKSLSREFFDKNPEAGEAILQKFKTMISSKQPNNAHYVLAMYDIPVITTNVDDLHEKAGSRDVLHLHGDIDNGVVLYGDDINMQVWNKAVSLVDDCDVLLVIGSSGFTTTQTDLLCEATAFNKKITIINDNCETKLPQYLELVFHG